MQILKERMKKCLTGYENTKRKLKILFRMIIKVDGITLENCFIIHLGAILDRQNF